MSKTKRIEDTFKYHLLRLSHDISMCWMEVFKSLGLRSASITFAQNARYDSQKMRCLRKEQYQFTGMK